MVRFRLWAIHSAAISEHSSSYLPKKGSGPIQGALVPGALLAPVLHFYLAASRSAVDCDGRVRVSVPRFQNDWSPNEVSYDDASSRPHFGRQ